MSEWVRVADAGACPVGQLKSVSGAGKQLVLANVDGDVYCLDDQCSHEAYPLSDGDLEGSDVVCMYHGARFDACTGRNKGLPAIRPVKSYPVQSRDDGIYVEI